MPLTCQHSDSCQERATHLLQINHTTPQFLCGPHLYRARKEAKTAKIVIARILSRKARAGLYRYHRSLEAGPQHNSHEPNSHEPNEPEVKEELRARDAGEHDPESIIIGLDPDAYFVE